MGLGNGNPKQGDRGSNHNYEHRELLILGKIVTAITGQLAPSPMGIATESTLQATNASIISVLDAIVATQDVEVILLRDEGVLPDPIVIKQITSYSTGAPVVTYETADGSPHVVVGPLVYLDPAAVMNLVLSELLDQGLTLDAIQTEALAQGISLDSILLVNTDVKTNTDSTATSLTNMKGRDSVAGGADGIRVLGNDGAVDRFLTTDASGHLQIDVLSNALPTGAATEVTLASILAKILVAPSTEAKQDTANALLTLIEADTGNILTDTNAMVVDLAAIEVEQLAQGVVQDGIATEQLAQGVVQDAQVVEQTAQGVSLDTVATETTGINTALAATVRTAALLVVSGVASTTVAAGARSVGFFNQGPTDATVAGGVLSAGESTSFEAGGQLDTLDMISYTTLATGVLKISTVV